MNEVIYRFRILGNEKWSYSDEPPKLKGIAHEVEKFIGPVIELEDQPSDLRADQR